MKRRYTVQDPGLRARDRLLVVAIVMIVIAVVLLVWWLFPGHVDAAPDAELKIWCPNGGHYGSAWIAGPLGTPVLMWGCGWPKWRSWRAEG